MRESGRFVFVDKRMRIRLPNRPKARLEDMAGEERDVVLGVRPEYVSLRPVTVEAEIEGDACAFDAERHT
ncbi:hypothetical protein A3842_24855 [Paenibacillus sp. P3E]|nr:hypothetical protein A3842_24855 [Paenibacillus sp. P3E]